jgi:hypothetical protein
MLSDQAATLFARFCFCGPLLYIGLLMVIDPASFVRFAEMLSGVLRTFEQRFRGIQWGPFSEPASFRVSSRTRKGVRFAGLVLTLYAFLLLAGLGN